MEQIQVAENFDEEEYNSEDEVEEKDDWGDWVEDDKDGLKWSAKLKTKSLFCDFFSPNPNQSLQYDKSTFGFDLSSIRKRFRLDIYKTIRLINYIRTMISDNRDIVDNNKLNSQEELINYMKQNNHFNFDVSADQPFWSDDRFLKPFLEDDPLLCSFNDDMEDSDFSDEGDIVENVQDENEKYSQEKLMEEIKERLEAEGINLEELIE